MTAERHTGPEAIADPHGYLALSRWLTFIASECEAYGLTVEATLVRRSLKFAVGSASEWFIEAEEAVRPLIRDQRLPDVVHALCRAVVDDIERGFRAIGGAQLT